MKISRNKGRFVVKQVIRICKAPKKSFKMWKQYRIMPGFVPRKSKFLAKESRTMLWNL